MRVVWTPEALQDREDIWNYIVEQNPNSAVLMDELFSHAVARLSEYPLFGKAGQIPGTRELIPHENYRLVYEIENEIVWILALVHASKQWPPLRH